MFSQSSYKTGSILSNSPAILREDSPLRNEGLSSYEFGEGLVGAVKLRVAAALDVLVEARGAGGAEELQAHAEGAGVNRGPFSCENALFTEKMYFPK